MASGCELHDREVIRVHACLYDQKKTVHKKKFSVDPQITTFDIMLKLITRAFNIQHDFTVTYLATDNYGDTIYLSLLSDWDLEAAFLSSVDDKLRLKVDIFSRDSDANDWKIVDPRTCVTNGNAISALRSLLSFDPRSPSTLIDSITDSLVKKMGKVQRAIGFRALLRASPNIQSAIPSSGVARQPNLHPNRAGMLTYSFRKPPLSILEFESFFDANGVLVRPNELRKSVFHGGVEPAVRRATWQHLLNCFPIEMDSAMRSSYLRGKAQEYTRMKERWKREYAAGQASDELRHIANSVRKDVLRTDRAHRYFAGEDNQHVVELFNILVTFALAHPTVSYVQGMSDLAAPLLVVQQDEAAAYLCFCALFRRLARVFSQDGHTMETTFEHFRALIRAYDPVFFNFLHSKDAADLIFAYRWLLLELKREFPLDDACIMLEILWSSLPSSSLQVVSAPHGVPLFERGSVFDDTSEVTAPPQQGAHDAQLIANPRTHGTATFSQSAPLTSPHQNGDTPSAPTSRLLGRTTQNGPIAHYAKMKAAHISSLKKRAQSDSCSQPQDKNTFTATRCFSLRTPKPDDLRFASSLVLTSGSETNGKVNVRKALLDSRSLTSEESGEARNKGAVFTSEDNKSGPAANDSCARVNVMETTNGPENCESDKLTATSSRQSSPERAPDFPTLRLPNSSSCTSTVESTSASTSNSVGDFSRLNDENLRVVDAISRSLQQPVESTKLDLADDSRYLRSHISAISDCSTPATPVAQPNDDAISSALLPRGLSTCMPSQKTSPSAKQDDYKQNNHIIPQHMRASQATTVSQSMPSSPMRSSSGVAPLGNPTAIENLPPPCELGDGNPFLLFLCLTILIQHRDVVMATADCECNDIGKYFSNLVRKHDVRSVICQAQSLYATYLQVQELKTAAAGPASTSASQRRDDLDRLDGKLPV